MNLFQYTHINSHKEEEELDSIVSEVKLQDGFTLEGRVDSAMKVLSNSEILPLPVSSDIEYGEEVRLKYRYLDLRRKKLHNNIILRNKIISSIRKKMIERGFVEFQTPILTSTSPRILKTF